MHSTRVCLQEDEASLTVYRILIILAEVVYGLSSCSSIVSRTRRQRLEAMVRSKRDTPFVVDDILTLLIVTDEAAVTIIESARSHYAAAKPDLAFRVILVADTPGGAAAEAFQVLKEEHGNVLLFVKEELARQEYVMNVQVCNASLATPTGACMAAVRVWRSLDRVGACHKRQFRTGQYAWTVMGGALPRWRWSLVATVRAIRVSLAILLVRHRCRCPPAEGWNVAVCGGTCVAGMVSHVPPCIPLPAKCSRPCDPGAER